MFRCALACILLTAVCLSAAHAVGPAANPRAVRDVMAGRIKVAQASWWGFDRRVDATACLQAAIDSGAPKLIVDDMGTPWIVDADQPAPATRRSSSRPASEILAKKGAFQRRRRLALQRQPAAQRHPGGYGATLPMRRSDYAAPPYTKAEWRHVPEHQQLPQRAASSA